MESLLALERNAWAEEGDAFLVLVVLDKLSGNNLFLISVFLSHDD